MFNDDEEAAWKWQRNNQIHRTLVEFLIQNRQPEIAAALLCGSIEVYSRQVSKPDVVYIEVPPAGYSLIAASE